ncbi:hypothetical protein [Flavobacterium sp. 5]|uniref:hypothetical protein n=1 Tax=Flavobacterium sp. 5 TaxID=2035199 RepID=UPI000C2C19B1|nr:hypothetical protein [Flavobacterium sp. 5]PKB18202.1 hypothetical protein CLU82_3464 [Flavobacterium sp. 5]
MRFRIVIRYVLLIVVVMATFVSCSNEDSKTGANDVSDAVKDGTWKVSYFAESGDDKTQDYKGYSFTFRDNSILTASKGTNSYTGVWSASKSSNDDDISSTIFMVTFDTPEVLINLSGNWKVVENTGNVLQLKDDSSGDSTIGHLYFEKI